jgi:hypothetical protein
VSSPKLMVNNSLVVWYKRPTAMIPVYVSNNILVVKTFSSTSLCLAPLNSNKRDRSYREVFKAKIILNFTFNNFIKVITIFCVGFTIRWFINDIWNVNVFTNYLNWISLSFYGFFSTFIVFINEFFSQYKFNSPIQIKTFKNIIHLLRQLWNGSDSDKITMGGSFFFFFYF